MAGVKGDHTFQSIAYIDTKHCCHILVMPSVLILNPNTLILNTLIHMILTPNIYTDSDLSVMPYTVIPTHISTKLKILRYRNIDQKCENKEIINSI